MSDNNEVCTAFSMSGEDEGPLLLKEKTGHVFTDI